MRDVSNNIIRRGVRTPRNAYILEEIQGEKWHIGKIDEIWIWHKRLGNLNFDNLVMINQS